MYTFKSILFLCLFLLLYRFGVSQGFNNFDGLQCKGTIPKNFRLTSKEKYEKIKFSGNTKLPRDERKLSQEFLINNTYLIDRLNRSGMILYGDTVTNYLNKVKGVLLKDYPELNKRVTIYTIRHSSLNAFATASGDIYFNIGLIANLQSEAEIAFVIAHEIMHIVNRHNIQQVLMNERFKESVKISNQNEGDEYLLKKHLYSQKHELEADQDGLLLYQKSNYSFDAIMSCFEILKKDDHSNYSFDPIEFLTKHESSVGNITINYEVDTLYIDSIESINIDLYNCDNTIEETSEKYSTHPSIKKRISDLDDIISKFDNDKRTNFILPKSNFESIRLFANLELVKLYLEDDELLKGFCHTMELNSTIPENDFIERYLAKYMFLIDHKKFNEKKYLRIVRKLESLDASQAKMAYIIDSQYDLDLSILFFTKMYDFSNSGSPLVKEQVSQLQSTLLQKMVSRYKSAFIDFNYNRFEYSKLLKDFVNNKNYKPLIKDALNQSEIKKTEKEDIDIENINQEVYLANVYINKDLSYYQNVIDEKVDTLIVANSFDLYFKYKNKIPVDWLKSEKIEKTFANRISHINSLDGITLYDLSNTDLQLHNDVLLNEHYVLNKWLMETLDHKQNLSHSSVEYDVRKLMKKYNTKYAMWNVCFSVRDSQVMFLKLYATAFYSMLVLPFAPQLISSVFQNLNRAYYMSCIFNLETGELVLVDKNSMLGNANKSIIGSYLYNTIYHLNNSPE